MKKSLLSALGLAVALACSMPVLGVSSANAAATTAATTTTTTPAAPAKTSVKKVAAKKPPRPGGPRDAQVPGEAHHQEGSSQGLIRSWASPACL